MSRYLLWLIVLNMIANVVAYVPRALLKEQNDGMVMGLVLSSIIGTLFMYWFLYQIRKFPEEGMPDLLEKYTQKWFHLLYSALNGLMFYFAGVITLLVFVDISERFINPDMGPNVTLFLFLLVVCGGVLLDSRSLLFVLEIVLIINLPLMIMIFIKAYTHDYFSWDSVKAVATHYREVPSWTTVSAGLYIYLGFLNLSVFNKYIKKLNIKWCWVVPLIGLVNLFTTVFVPVGINGTVLPSQYTFPWISTVDSMRIEFGIIERVLFIFLLLYIGISLLSIMIHWHVALNWLKVISPVLKRKNKSYSPYFIVAIFCLSSYFLQLVADEKKLFDYTNLWFASLIPAIVIMNLVLFWLIRRGKQ